MTYFKKFTLLMSLLLCGVISNAAELVYSSPAIVQQSSKNIVVYFNAAEGTAG